MAKKKEQDGGELSAFVFGLLLGSLAAAGAALWYAPQSGRRTREEIAQKGADAAHAVEHTVDQVRQRVEGESIDDALEDGKTAARQFMAGRMPASNGGH